jgi:DNA-binding beta-propeller fold protein YncE
MARSAVAGRRRFGLRARALYAVAAAVLINAGCGSARPAGPSGAVRHVIYAAQDDGTVHVYDIDSGHRLVRTISVFPCCGDVRGAAVAVPTHRFYVMYNRDNEGRVASVDVVTGKVIWDKVLHVPGVDRGNITPDGSTLYLPTGEDDASSSSEVVVDALTGEPRGRLFVAPRSHDTIVTGDGKRVFVETKSPTGTMYVASTATNRVETTITGYCCGGVLGPFSINGRGTLMVNDVVGFAGFELADVTTGHVIASIPIEPSGTPGHGIAFTPDEGQVWLTDGAKPDVYVFDMSASPPRQVDTVSVSNPGPHWVTFDIDGRFAYVAGRKGSADPTDVIDTRSHQRVARLSGSEDLVEVDMRAGAVVAVGNQFGVGRRPS